ncbi:MAG: hypothetical protein ACTSPY_09695 [Candidatus Helarchaeota archaeon]
MQEIFGYVIGITLAISAGICTQLGLGLQKLVVNRHRMKKGFGKKLVKEPLWIIGLLLELGLSALLLILAIDFIGNVLTPGLMAGGLIVLVIFSIHIIKEKLNKLEIFGILLMIGAIVLLSLSGMEVDVGEYDFLATDFLFRLTLFTSILGIIGLIMFILNYRIKNITVKGIFLVNIGGLGFAISNLWIGIMTDFLLDNLFVFSSILEIILFVSCAVILVLSNVIGVMGNNAGFKYGQASNLIPISQIAPQITPIFYYLVVFFLPIPSPLSLIFLICGIFMILISSYLLSRRQEELSEIKLED